MPAIDRGQLPHRRVQAAQRQHRRERAVIWGTQLHDPSDPVGTLAPQRNPRHDAAHAVTHQHDAGGCVVRVDALVQLAGQVADAAPPVVGMGEHVETGDPQRQLQLERVEQHHAQCDQPGTRGQREPREMAGRDLQQVDPEDVVQQQSPRTQPRAHESWQQVDAWAAWPARRRRAPRERAQFAIALFTEQRAEFGASLAAGQQPLDVLVVQAMNGQRKCGSGQRNEVLAPAAPVSAGSRANRPEAARRR